MPATIDPAGSGATLPAFHLLLIAPNGYQHSLALAELVETLAHALVTLGYPVTLGLNQPHSDAINIVLGAHLATAEMAASLPQSSVIFNVEQVNSASTWMKGELPKLVARFPTWDYSTRNIEKWRTLVPDAQVSLLPIGYVAALSRISRAGPQDIDVLFYGTVVDRRRRILDELRARGVNLHVASDCYGLERDALIARSRIVLNLHAYDAHIFEIVRVSYLLANCKAVVTEVGPNTDIDPLFRDAVAAAPYEDLVDTCMRLLANDDQRIALEQRGYEIMRSVDAVACVRERIAALHLVATA